TFTFIAPDELKLPEQHKMFCKSQGIKFEEHSELNEQNIADTDILYMTRVQKERFTDLFEYEKVKNVYILKNSLLEHTKPNLKILHPLPRVNEIEQEVDENEKAYYFQQAKNGVYARQAVICDLLGL
ncbi:MAG TPA: aspartate carbamoyltransferase, partial [Paludibacteraceae bacterium]|nr:aspartate carbamoyltransferase [Paludibacteraceae bacterium]